MGYPHHILPLGAQSDLQKSRWGWKTPRKPTVLDTAELSHLAASVGTHRSKPDERVKQTLDPNPNPGSLPLITAHKGKVSLLQQFHWALCPLGGQQKKMNSVAFGKGVFFVS